MSKSTLFALFVFIQYGVVAQKKTTFLLQPSMGYETNILRSPSTSVSDSNSLSRSELWKNAPYGAFDFTVIRKLSDYHKVRAKTMIKRSFLTEGIGIRSNDFQFQLRHDYKGKRFRNSSSVGFRNLVRSGNNEFRDILGAPLTYKRVTLSNRSTISLSKTWSLMAQSFAELKIYDRADFDQFRYLDLGLRMQGNYRYTDRQKMGIRILGAFHQRNYQISKVTSLTIDEEIELDEEEFDEFEEIEERARKWNYYTLGVSMRFPKKKHVITSGLSYTLRTDLTEGRFGYQQLAWDFGYQLKLKSIRLGLSNSITARLYPNLADGSEMLKYIYFNPIMTLRKQLSKRVDFLLKASVRYRYSSLDKPSRSAMRSYLTSSFSTGFIFKLERKDRPKY